MPDIHDPLPESWDDAHTISQVVRIASGRLTAVRFGDYYRQPCLVYLVRRLSIPPAQAEDIVQDFFCELEEPLAKGRHAGAAWKVAIRSGFDGDRGQFRAYLSRILRNFAYDWLRRQRRGHAASGTSSAADGLERQCALAEVRWRACWDRFLAASGGGGRAERALGRRLLDDVAQMAVAAELGVTDRTVRSDCQAAAERLASWIRSVLPPVGVRAGDLARTGADQLPGWCSHLSADKRQRTLLLLAVVEAVAIPPA